MRQLNIPLFPDPTSPVYRGNVLAWQRAVNDWGQRVKGVLEDGFRELSSPCGQQISASAFTTNTAVTGTTTGTDLANAVCSLISVLEQGGVTSPTISRTQTQ